ncbi:hypothetical protein RJZ56_000569 [Blastomyces dermatitidis]|uniref:Uncharacterized protein n=2 Tax=Ajellomyces dermatitidis TaxID=5039 RepID=F2T9L5_AJEDA|nr:uncharacterized protein BDCG_00912 [Blastomyces dermatitidis ER-3]EEQ84107.1 hypothetical protein BDCG_00912 [Blastomyces dermatitidis ER-3]EGE79928.2 hypothetical protein BDDG_02869 [Blastomyces dermatitidis ATCC 18188]EQL31264.1 hypothetical protein BDFG_06328 [Blastomyces dermatitidis ATCC 26199]
MTSSIRTFRSVSSPSSRQLHEPRNSNRASKRFSLGIFSNSDLSRSSTATTASGKETRQCAPTSNEVDLLPNDQIKLEEIANYHLGQIGRLAIEIAHCNEQVELLPRTKLPEGMECIARKHYERMQAAEDWLKLLENFQDFHRQEVERIKELKKKLMMSNALDSDPLITLSRDDEFPNTFCDYDSYT